MPLVSALSVLVACAPDAADSAGPEADALGPEAASVDHAARELEWALTLTRQASGATREAARLVTEVDAGGPGGARAGAALVAMAAHARLDGTPLTGGTWTRPLPADLGLPTRVEVPIPDLTPAAALGAGASPTAPEVAAGLARDAAALARAEDAVRAGHALLVEQWGAPPPACPVSVALSTAWSRLDAIVAAAERLGTTGSVVEVGLAALARTADRLATEPDPDGALVAQWERTAAVVRAELAATSVDGHPLLDGADAWDVRLPEPVEAEGIVAPAFAVPDWSGARLGVEDPAPGPGTAADVAATLREQGAQVAVERERLGEVARDAARARDRVDGACFR